MTALGFLFYLLAGLILASAALAATRRNPMHAVGYAVVTFLATAGLFVVLGAPLPGVLEVVIYAGAIMVLFLFIIMLLGLKTQAGAVDPNRLVLPGTLAVAVLVTCIAVLGRDPAVRIPLPAAMASPAVLGQALFGTWWLAVETVSILLFAALAAVLLLGRAGRRQPTSRGGPAA